VGAYWVAIFHLYTHAFFKALLFLGSGSVIHALSGEQDMRRMGGLKDKIPTTHWTMLVGTLAIAGVPGLAGFFSKDEILWQVFNGSSWIWLVGLLTAGMTAFYMWRLMALTFYGASRVEPKVAAHVHESPRVMTLPLVVLAIGSSAAGWIGVPKIWSALPEVFRTFEHWLESALAPAAAHAVTEQAHPASTEWLLMLLSVAVAGVGIALAWRLYQRRPEQAEALRQAAGPLYTAAYHKWYVDEIYDFLFVNGLAKGGGNALVAFDNHVVDGGVNGAGWLARLTSRASIWWDTWIVDGAVRLGSFLVKMSSFPARVAQTGYVQVYALVFVLGVALMFGYYLMR
jgi:NADH-quinone oxidoreductase subunit L